MEIKQEFSENPGKVEIDNEECDIPLETFKVEIKEETLGYLDLKECHIKTEIEDESPKERETKEKGFSCEDIQTDAIDVLKKNIGHVKFALNTIQQRKI
ncbi:uncharacterized protein [Diabrotica undecimpunctata]|uniref:uncharacterized protein isoform X2 n=1 Tax=Diabrotica undecimpunctata TaxID=50387 RepID=UPI003B63A722